MRILCLIVALLDFLVLAIYLPIMSYREVVVPLTDKAIIIGILGIYFLLYGREA